jgi:hypothetical protein
MYPDRRIKLLPMILEKTAGRRANVHRQDSKGQHINKGHHIKNELSRTLKKEVNPQQDLYQSPARINIYSQKQSPKRPRRSWTWRISFILSIGILSG